MRARNATMMAIDSAHFKMTIYFLLWGMSLRFKCGKSNYLTQGMLDIQDTSAACLAAHAPET